MQYCKNAGRNLKYLAEKGRKIWITSSSEVILSKEVLSYLVGRVSILRLYPFSIKEFLRAKGQKEFTPKILERNVWEHLTFGGYPKVLLTDDIEMKKTILRDLYETMILKDIARTFSIEDITSLEEFVKYLAINTGGIVSYEKLSKTIKLSFQTVKKYLSAMEKSYLVIRVLPFCKNKSKEIAKQPKVYFIDSGLRNAITRSFEAAIGGNLFENYVLSELIKLGVFPKYWHTKTGAEVDFIIEKENGVFPVEVKLDSDEGMGKGLRSFIETYKPKKAFIIFYKGEEKEMAINGCKVMFRNVVGIRDILA